MKTRGSWARLWGCLGTAIRFQGAPAVGEGKECERRLRCKIPAVRRGPCNRIPWTYLSLPRASGDERTKKGSEVHRRPISRTINCYLFNMTRSVPICSDPWLQPEPRRVVK